MEFTVALIKPDATRAGHTLGILRIMNDEFILADIMMGAWPLAMAEAFYADHQGREYHADLCRFMSSGPVLACTLVGPDAVARWRARIGPTDPREARYKDGGSIRSLYGSPMGPVMYNAVHGSDSVDSAIKEAARDG